MQSKTNARASTLRTLLHLIAVCLVAALLGGGSLLVLPDQAVLAAGTCTSTADGSWSDPSIWDCGHIPTSADDLVVIDSDVTIDADQSANDLTINLYGILTVLSPVTLTINGDFDIQGIFDDHEDGTVLLAGTDQTILTHGDWVDFENLTKIARDPGETLFVDPASDGTGGIHVLEDLTLQGTPSAYLLLRSTSPGSQWQLNLLESYDVEWVDVQDSDNTSSFVVDVPYGTDSGNNANWSLDNLTASSVELISSANPSFSDLPVTFTATVSPAMATGTVTFQDGGVDIAGCVSVALTDGVATCTVDSLDYGSHTITALYSGDGTYDANTSAPLVQEILEEEAKLFLPIITR